LFKEDTKRIYRNLVMKNIEAREPRSMEEAGTYWKSLWEEEWKSRMDKKGREKESYLHGLDSYTYYGKYFIFV